MKLHPKYCADRDPIFSIGILLGISLGIIYLNFTLDSNSTSMQTVNNREYGNGALSERSRTPEELNQQKIFFQEPTTYRDKSAESDHGTNKNFTDELLYDDIEAKRLETKITVTCFVMTVNSELRKATLVKTTWGMHCTKLLFFSTVANVSFPTIGLGLNNQDQNMPHDPIEGFKYLYKNHINDSEWFLSATADVFVCMENLRYFLMMQNPNESIQFGCRYKGIILSRQALRQFIQARKNDEDCRQREFYSNSIISCLHNIGVKRVSTTDRHGKRRIVCYDRAYTVFNSNPATVKNINSNQNGILTTPIDVSDYVIMFTYLRMEIMETYNYLMYHLRPYGIVKKPEDLSIAEF